MKAFVITFLTILLVSILGHSQITSGEKDDLAIIKRPQFKGQDVAVALNDYFYSGNAFGFFGRESGLSYYEMAISFSFDSDGSLKKASIEKSSGFKSLDRKVLMLSKNFCKKRYMAPACSANGPIPYDITVPIVCKYLTLSHSSNNAALRYLSGGHSMYSKWTDLYTPPPYNP